MLRAPTGDPLPRVIDAVLAGQLGYTAANIRTELACGRWDRLVRGVYVTRGEIPTRPDWVRAGLSIAGPGAVLSGWDAVHASGLGSERPPSPDVLVLSQDGTNRAAGRVRVRPSRRALSTRRLVLPGCGTVPAADVARCVADTALLYRTLAPVRALVTSAVQREFCTPAELAEELATGPRNGSAHLRRAIADVLEGAASISEAELADTMRDAGLPEFELNVRILDRSGRHIATADVLWRALRAVLEVDSRQHHFLEPQWRSTMRRHNMLTGLGLAVTHFPPVELRGQTARVMAEIGAWLQARAAELGVPYPPPPLPDSLRRTPFSLDQQVRTVA
jgi:very-short-patch-repair endonuclease